MALAVIQFKWLPKQMFPLSERNQFLIYMNMPDGTDIAQTETSALAISKWLADPKQNPEVKSHILYIGDGGPRFYLTLTPVPPDPAAAFFLVNTKDFQGAIRAADRAWKYLYQNRPEARFKIKRLAMGSVEVRHRRCRNLGARCGSAAGAWRTRAIVVPGCSGNSRQ